MSLTTFIIPSIGRPTLQRAIDSVREHPYLVEIDKNKIGEAAIRNGLIKLAETEYVSFLDDDDTVTADYVEKLELEVAKAKNKGIIPDLIVFKEYFIGELMNTKGMEDHFIWQKPEVEFGEIGIAFSVRRQIALDHQFLDEKHEELYLVKRVQEAGYNIIFSPY